MKLQFASCFSMHNCDRQNGSANEAILILILILILFLIRILIQILILIWISSHELLIRLLREICLLVNNIVVRIGMRPTGAVHLVAHTGGYSLRKPQITPVRSKETCQLGRTKRGRIRWCSLAVLAVVSEKFTFFFPEFTFQIVEQLSRFWEVAGAPNCFSAGNFKAPAHEHSTRNWSAKPQRRGSLDCLQWNWSVFTDCSNWCVAHAERPLLCGLEKKAVEKGWFEHRERIASRSTLGVPTERDITHTRTCRMRWVCVCRVGPYARAKWKHWPNCAICAKSWFCFGFHFCRNNRVCVCLPHSGCRSPHKPRLCQHTVCGLRCWRCAQYSWVALGTTEYSTGHIVYSGILSELFLVICANLLKLIEPSKFKGIMNRKLISAVMDLGAAS